MTSGVLGVSPAGYNKRTLNSNNKLGQTC